MNKRQRKKLIRKYWVKSNNNFIAYFDELSHKEPSFWEGLIKFSEHWKGKWPSEPIFYKSFSGDEKNNE